MSKLPVRVAVFTTDSFFSYSILRGVLEDPQIDCAALVVLPGTGNGSPLSTIRRVHRRSGWRLVAYKISTSIAVAVRSWISRVNRGVDRASPSGLARRHNIPVISARDCNDPTLVQVMRDLGVHILLSVNVYQRMEQPLLDVPSVAAVNTHFGMLPHYRGMSPVLWAMSRGEQEFGVTVHRMVLAFDEGKILRQSALPLGERDSVLRATLRGCEEARELLVEAVHEVYGDPDAGTLQEPGGSYFSLPTRDSIRKLRRQGRALARLSDLSLMLR